MEVPTAGKSPNTSLSFRYNANNEEIEELFNACEDDPPTPQCDPPSTAPSENASPKKGDRTPSIIDKYFKSIRAEKPIEKEKDDLKVTDKPVEESRSSSTPKEITSSPMKEYLNRLGKRSTPEVNESRESSNETWKIFHDFKFKIAQAVEDMKTRSLEETKEGKEKSVPRENSMSDSEENSAVKDVDQQSVGDTDNQVSSLDSSMQNLSDITQPLTAKATERELSLPVDTKNHSDSSDDTHKNLVYSEMADRDLNLTDNMLEVESGVEALEDTMDGFGDVTNPQPIIAEDNKTDTPSDKPSTPIPSNFNLPPSNSNLKKQEKKPKKEKKYFLNFTMYFLTFLLIVNFLLFRNSSAWNGFLLGVWFFSLFSDLKSWVMDNYFGNWEPRKGSFLQEKSNYNPPVTYTIPSVKEHMPMKKYEGWINHYRSPEYDPYNYHINKTTTAFVKLEGCNLRISYTKTKVAKRALWDEKIENISFYQHRLYNLTGARVILLPKGLVKRRQWSKKYPICVILSDKENIQVLEKETLPQTDKRPSEVTTIGDKKKEQESESTETSASPEKKKKSVWRRREKSVSVTPVPHVEGEPGKEGLRHRLVRKMHRDKKSEILSTAEPEAATSCACPEEAEVKERPKDSDDELDDHEITRIRECLEEAEWDAGEDYPVDGSEWSVHIKNTTDKHSHLFLFARTGRDKHEWFRRLNTAVAEANVGSAESSTSAEDKPPEPEADKKDGIEIAAYKFTEKDTVAFAKSYNKSTESISEGVLFNNLSMSPLPTDSDMYEKNFWPYLINILQSHEMTLKQTADIGVNCQLEPTPHERQKNKKKKKVPSKSSSPPCPCRALPADVTWLNSALARVFYDLMRDPQMIARLQNRIQRKLNTLKLPSFMSPLVVEELSLAGACPLVARVLPAGADARGVWLDADLRYAGGAYITLLTQINLMKLKEKNLTLEEQLLTATDNIVENDMNVSSTCGIFSEKQLRKNKPAIFDSDVEDSAESSSDDDSHPLQPVDSAESTHVSEAASTMTTSTEGGSSKKKFLRMVDKIATNKYFQQVTDYKYIKRAMEGLSNTDIKLHLEVQGLEGRLAFNLPPPPHDRLWIGFRTNPQLVLKARPAVGARMLRFAHISNWIEQKLSKEFEKVLVLPNMEDFIIDVMTPTPVNFE